MTHLVPTARNAPLLRLQNVAIQYRTAETIITAVQQVSFDLNRGERCVLLGPSGSGKSSLLRAIAGVERPAAGEIALDGVAVSRPWPNGIIVSQEFDQLLPWKTVRENIALPLVESGLARSTAVEKADAHIERVGLGKFAGAYPHALSGGMKQRITIARAIALEPAILLMDEPFAALDVLTRRKMQEELKLLSDDFGFSLLFVTHSIEEAIAIGSRILLLSPHPGSVRADLNVPPSVNQGGEGYVSLQRHINELLFNGASPLERVSARG
jgi:NitT/TauT family transport system ATP-binding protein